MILKTFVLMCSLALYKGEHDLDEMAASTCAGLSIGHGKLVMCLQLGGNAALLHRTAIQSARMPLDLEMILILFLVLTLYMCTRTQLDWGKEWALLLRIRHLMGMDG